MKQVSSNLPLHITNFKTKKTNMNKQRLETFGDAIIAIVLTILVLKLAQPTSLTLSGFLNINTFILLSILPSTIFWYFNEIYCVLPILCGWSM